jgi:hypothetical protein
MEQPTSSGTSPCSSGEADLVLPVPEEPIPRYHGMPLEWVFARNMQVMAETRYDEAYFARSLARKVDVPFVM